MKTHSVDENNNSMIDDVVQVLTDLADKYDISIDVPHHQNKGPADPGNANRGRGASAMKDAGRLVYTATPMSEDEAKSFGVSDAQRRRLIRIDSAKVNIAPPMHQAQWFRLVGVPLCNGNDLYPNGDEVQTVEPWSPPEAFDGMPDVLLNTILNDIERGMPGGVRYSAHPNAKSRAAWRVILAHAPSKPEGSAKEIIRAWIKSGLLIEDDYHDEARRETVKGLKVDDSKRPGTTL